MKRFCAVFILFPWEGTNQQNRVQCSFVSMAKSQWQSIRLRPLCKWWSFRSVTSNVHPKRDKHVNFKQQLTTIALGSAMVRYLYLLTQLIIIKQILYHKARLLTLKLPLNLSTNEAPLLPKSKRQNKRSATVTKRKQRTIPRRRINLLINLRNVPNVPYMFTNRCWKGFIQRAFLTKRKTR